MADRTAAYGYMLPLATNAYTVPFDIRIRKRDIRTAYFNRIFHYISLSNCKSPTTNLTSINDSHGLDRYRSIRPRTNGRFFVKSLRLVIFLERDSIYEYSHFSWITGTRACPTRKNLLAIHRPDALTWRTNKRLEKERERERGVGGEEEGQSCCVWLNIRIHVLCCNEWRNKCF